MLLYYIFLCFYFFIQLLHLSKKLLLVSSNDNVHMLSLHSESRRNITNISLSASNSSVFADKDEPLLASARPQL